PLKRHTDVHWQPTRNLKTPQRIDTLQLDNFLTTGFLDILPLKVPLEFLPSHLLAMWRYAAQKGGRSLRALQIHQPVWQVRAPGFPVQ
ncbi:Smr/MutS family endonuclease, partial [Salmonella enterica subsp. enterica serovar Montevideo]|nr:Smr/MutS family endonuclease [Salmonella enterica subsp. enterica serovar Montevideo]